MAGRVKADCGANSIEHPYALYGAPPALVARNHLATRHRSRPSNRSTSPPESRCSSRDARPTARSRRAVPTRAASNPPLRPTVPPQELPVRHVANQTDRRAAVYHSRIVPARVGASEKIRATPGLCPDYWPLPITPAPKLTEPPRTVTQPHRLRKKRNRSLRLFTPDVHQVGRLRWPQETDEYRDGNRCQLGGSSSGA